MSRSKEWLKGVLGPKWQARARGVSRLRWIAKYRVLARCDLRMRDNPRLHLPYVLWDPELESYTYDVANVDELAEFLDIELGIDREQASRFLREPDADPTFNAEWRRRMRWRFDIKHRMQLGNRLIWWGLVRALRPRLIVECGIFTGVGSLVLLRALQRNREEGAPGELLSIDSDPTMGWAVPAEFSDHWTIVTGLTTDVLGECLEGQRVDLLIHDTPHTYDNQVHEFRTAVEHAGDRLVLVDSGGRQTTALSDVCAEHGGRYGYFREVPKNHFYPVNGSGIGIFRGSRASASL